MRVQICDVKRLVGALLIWRIYLVDFDFLYSRLELYNLSGSKPNATSRVGITSNMTM